LNNNVIMLFGVSGLVPGKGFKDLYSNLTGTQGGLVAAFMELNLAY
jgi:hypothetical protein